MEEQLKKLVDEMRGDVNSYGKAISRHLSMRFATLRKEIECDVKGISENDMNTIEKAVREVDQLSAVFHLYARGAILDRYQDKIKDIEPSIKAGKNPYPKDMDMLTISAHLEGMKKLVKFLDGEVRQHLDTMFVWCNMWMSLYGERTPKNDKCKVVSKDIFKNMTDNLVTYYHTLFMVSSEDLAEAYSRCKYIVQSLQKCGELLKDVNDLHLRAFSESMGVMNFNPGKYHYCISVEGELKQKIDKCCADHSYHMINFVNKSQK